MAKEKWYRFYLYLLLEALRRIILWLPSNVSRALAAGAGRLAYFVLRRDRRRVRRHLRRAFSQRGKPIDTRDVAQKVFVNLSKTAVDICRFPKLTREYLNECVTCDPKALEALDSSLSHGRGAIALTAHLGNWELLGAYLRFLGYPGKVVGRQIYYHRYDQVVMNLRMEGLISTIYRKTSAWAILRTLKKNHIIGILADQNIDHLEGIYVPFFGEPAWTLVAPARISLASGAPIVPMFLLHEDGGYRLVIEPPIWPVSDGDEAETVKQLTFEWARVVEAYIREYPEQWTWMHNRWKKAVFHPESQN